MNVFHLSQKNKHFKFDMMSKLQIQVNDFELEDNNDS